ncbi:MAG: tRNA-dihydrouridine synthase family protein [Desulfoplanes sp.]
MDEDIACWLRSSLVVKDRPLPGRLALAPMSKLGHIAMRELLAEYGGCGLMFSEMCSSKAVPGANPRVSPCFTWREQELSQLVCQIFGSEPEDMARAAERVEREGFFGVDVNMGCSVAGICKHGCGAALLRDPDRAVAIVQTMRRAVSIPIFVKFRTGWKDDPCFAVDMARRLEDAGADCLTFHPRVAPDRRSRPPKWEYIARVKEGVSIPVLGNGNVFTLEDCALMRERTGCDGIALGRMAIARPWIFALWTGRLLEDPGIYKQCALRYVDLVEKYFGEQAGLRYFKKFSQYFAANFIYGHALWPKLWKADTLDGLRENIDRLLTECPAVSLRPSLYMFTT